MDSNNFFCKLCEKTGNTKDDIKEHVIIDHSMEEFRTFIKENEGKSIIGKHN